MEKKFHLKLKHNFLMKISFIIIVYKYYRKSCDECTYLLSRGISTNLCSVHNKNSSSYYNFLNITLNLLREKKQILKKTTFLIIIFYLLYKFQYFFLTLK